MNIAQLPVNIFGRFYFGNECVLSLDNLALSTFFNVVNDNVGSTTSWSCLNNIAVSFVFTAVYFMFNLLTVFGSDQIL